MLISIIIPIFDKEAVIGRTIDSVLAQGLKEEEYELILIDDGSRDQSLSICNAYREKHPNIIKVILKGNEGQSKTRDLGIDSASGDYIYFMDADDYLIEGGLRYVIDHFLNKEIDVLFFFSKTIPNFNDYDVPQGDIEGKIVYDGEGCDYLKSAFFIFIWNQIYRLSFIKEHHISFQDMLLAEDVFFNLQVWTKNPRVRVTSSRIYRYIEYPGDGQLTKNRDHDGIKKTVDSYMKLFKEIASLDPHFKTEYGSDRMETLFKSQLWPFVSRILSSQLSVNEFRATTGHLKKLQLLPLKGSVNKSTKVIESMMRTPRLLPLYQKVYQSIVIPHIIPRIDRETGKFHFKVGSQRNTF